MERNFAQTALDQQLAAGEEMSDYVAHLQMHMALQARNLVPTLTNAQAGTTGYQPPHAPLHHWPDGCDT